jgi:hypothetical protein
MRIALHAQRFMYITVQCLQSSNKTLANKTLFALLLKTLC